MKYLNLLIVCAFLAPAIAVTTGCKDDPVDPPIQPKDTTDNNDTTDNEPDTIYLNSFKLGFDIYELEVSEGNTTANYNIIPDLTKIVLVGNDAKKGYTEVNMNFPGDSLGIYKQIDGDDVLLEITINKGDPVKEVTYQTDPNSNVVFNISKYGVVGDTIIGTFSAKLKSGINTKDVKEGKFAVIRKNDI